MSFALLLLNLFLSILLLLVLNGIVYLIAFSDCPLQVYKNTIDFCVLIFISSSPTELLVLIVF